MATRNDEAGAEKAYADASASVPATPTAATAVAAKKTAVTADEGPAPATIAKPAPAKAAPAKPVQSKPAAKPVARKAKPAPAKAANASARPALTRSKVKIAGAQAPAPTSKGLVMVNEAPAKFTEEATKVANEAKARTEAFVADFQSRAREAAEKSQDLAKDAVDFSKGNVEALVDAARIAAKGFEAVSQELVAYAKQAMTDTTEAAQRYAAVKTPAEFFQLQSELSRTALDSAVKQGAKTTEMTVKLANDAFQPLSNRISLAVSKLKTAA